MLGVGGMLGHKMFQTLASSRHEIMGTLRTELPPGPLGSFLAEVGPISTCVSALDFGTVRSALDKFRPDVVINAIGIVKQRKAARDPVLSIRVNSLLPHQLARWAVENECKLIHFSTDCVFSGSKGGYTEDDIADPADLYGRSKLLGEGTAPTLTLRTSIVGRELSTYESLVEWFIARDGSKVNGFRKACYSGLTTLEASKIVVMLVDENPDLEGLYHLAGPWITKYELLCEIRDQMGLGIEIVPDTEFAIDRTLVGDRLAKATGIRPVSWESMITEMVNDPTPYEELR